MAPKLIIPVEQHFTGRVTYRGSGFLAKIKEKFEAYNLIGRVKESPLKQFFMAGELKFSGVLLHQLMLHKIRAEREQEVQFYVGRTKCRFGLTEFALITGLNFTEGPSEAEVTAHLTSNRLLMVYFNSSSKVTLDALLKEFTDCTVPNDVYKLGLCLFVEGVLYAREGNRLVWLDMIKLVEDVEFFFKYPWGKLSFEKLIRSCQKDMHHKKKNFDKKADKKGVQKESKYSVYGYAPALQYWAFESILELAKRYGVKYGNQIPRMLSWTSKTDIAKIDLAPLFAKKLNVMACLFPRPAESEYVQGLTVGDAPLYVDMGVDETQGDDSTTHQSEFQRQAAKVAEFAQSTNIFPVDPPPPPPPAPATTASSSQADQPNYGQLADRLERVEGQQSRILNGQTEIKDTQAAIMGQMKTIMSMIQDLQRPTTQPCDRSNVEDNLPENYVVDDPGTSALMEIVSLGDTQTPVGGQDCDVEEAEPFANRKRPIYLDDYTSMRKKACAARTVVNMDPLQVHMIKPPILTPKLEHNTISSTLTLLLQDQSSMNRFGVNYFMSMEKKKKVLEEKICKIGLTIQAVEEKYAKLNKKREEIEQTIKELQDSTETHQLGFLNHLSTKEEVIEQIEKISNSSTAVLVNISRGVPFREPENHIMKDIIGVVALLGRVQCGQLSRILSEYLGADQMLAVVARSFEAAAQFETYTQTGEVDRSYALHAEAAVLGKSINCRFTVICFDKICLYKGGFNNHPQRRLALPVPWFIDGTIPKGFLGFAVNMIDLDEDHLSIKNNSGYGLRETVFYRLFGQLQVYQTREDMLAACACIKHGAVSLDGGILKENGVLSFGFSDPQVCFQVVTTNDEMPLSQENLKLLQDQKSELKIINDKIEQNIKHHGLALNSFKKTKKELKKMMDELETCIGSNTQ